MQNLINWFADQDYAKGVAILKQHDKKNKKLSFFESVEGSKPGSLHHNLLKTELERIKRIKAQTTELPKAAKNNAVIAVAEDKTVEQEETHHSPLATHHSIRTRIIKENPNFKFEDLSPEMQELYNEIGDDYKKMSAFHAKAKLEEITAEDRKHAINLAAQLEDGIQAKYKILDEWIKAWHEGDNLETSQPENTVSEVAVNLQRLKNIRTYITRETKKLDAMPEGSEDYQKQLEKVEELKTERDNLEEWKKENNL